MSLEFIRPNSILLLLISSLEILLPCCILRVYGTSQKQLFLPAKRIDAKLELTTPSRSNCGKHNELIIKKENRPIKTCRKPEASHAIPRSAALARALLQRSMESHFPAPRNRARPRSVGKYASPPPRPFPVVWARHNQTYLELLSAFSLWSSEGKRSSAKIGKAATARGREYR